MSALSNPRICAASILTEVVADKKSLNAVIDTARKSSEMALTKQLCFGTCRYYFQLKHIQKNFLKKSIKAKEMQVEMLLLCALYELIYLNTQPHAVVNETVEALKIIKKHWAVKLINGILRNFLRQKSQQLENLTKNPVAFYAHPLWLIEKIKKAYPTDFQKILAENNKKAPMILRVNQQKITTQNYLEKLKAHDIEASTSPICDSAIVLKSACQVQALPGFFEGECSIQDVHAQLAVNLLPVDATHRVLDACAAPGGKSAHLLEKFSNDLDLTVLDVDAHRIPLVLENFERLHLSAKILTADATALNDWWDKNAFDRILLDAPCSATGVIRRHPDIKLLRQESDIAQLQKTQRALLKTLWQTLKSGGKLLYCTCSVLPEENMENIQWFLQTTQNATIQRLSLASSTTTGLQKLPGDACGDGFYYCLLNKA